MVIRRAVLATMLLPAILAWGCSDSDNDNVTQPATTSASQFFAPLTPPQVQPAVQAGANVPSGGMTMTLNLSANNAGTIQGATGVFNVNFTGFQPGSVLTSAHVNSGAIGVIGPVVIDLGITAGQVNFPNGFGSLTRTVQVSPAVAAQILANPAGFYFEGDTVDSPAGAVRGQLVNVTVVAH